MFNFVIEQNLPSYGQFINKEISYHAKSLITHAPITRQELVRLQN